MFRVGVGIFSFQPRCLVQQTHEHVNPTSDVPLCQQFDDKMKNFTGVVDVN